MKKEILSKIFCVAIFFLCVSSNAQVKKWTLEECVLYALDNNISIKQSQLDLKISDVEKLEAYGNFLPTLSTSANYSVNTGANINPATNQFNSSPAEAAKWRARVNVSSAPAGTP